MSVSLSRYSVFLSLSLSICILLPHSLSFSLHLTQKLLPSFPKFISLTLDLPSPTSRSFSSPFLCPPTPFPWLRLFFLSFSFSFSLSIFLSRFLSFFLSFLLSFDSCVLYPSLFSHARMETHIQKRAQTHTHSHTCNKI